MDDLDHLPADAFGVERAGTVPMRLYRPAFPRGGRFQFLHCIHPHRDVRRMLRTRGKQSDAESAWVANDSPVLVKRLHLKSQALVFRYVRGQVFAFDRNVIDIPAESLL